MRIRILSMTALLVMLPICLGGLGLSILTNNFEHAAWSILASLAFMFGHYCGDIEARGKCKDIELTVVPAKH